MPSDTCLLIRALLWDLRGPSRLLNMRDAFMFSHLRGSAITNDLEKELEREGGQKNLMWISGFNNNVILICAFVCVRPFSPGSLLITAEETKTRRRPRGLHIPSIQTHTLVCGCGKRSDSYLIARSAAASTNQQPEGDELWQNEELRREEKEGRNRKKGKQVTFISDLTESWKLWGHLPQT